MFNPAQLRGRMKEKAHRLATGEPRGKIDASSWRPEPLMHTEVKTGMRPKNPRMFKRGGKVEGEKAKTHAGRAQRKRAGKDLGGALANAGVSGVDPRQAAMQALQKSAQDTNVMPNRMGFNPTQRSPLIGLKKGGKADAKGDSNYTGGTRPTGGRIARAHGGRAKKSGKTNIIISVNPGGQQAAAPPMPPMMPPRPPAQPIPVPTPPPGMQGAPPMGAPPMMPPPMPPGGPPMPRKAGGRTNFPTVASEKRAKSYKDMDAGALSGLGRIAKTAIAEKKYAKAP